MQLTTMFLLIGLLISPFASASTAKNFIYSFCNQAEVCYEVQSPMAKRSVLKNTYYMPKAKVKVYKQRQLVGSYQLNNFLLNNDKKVLFKPGGKLIDMKQNTL